MLHNLSNLLKQSNTQHDVVAVPFSRHAESLGFQSPFRKLYEEGEKPRPGTSAFGLLGADPCLAGSSLSLGCGIR